MRAIGGTAGGALAAGITPLSGVLFREFLTDDGTPTGNDDLIVNGSITPVEFFIDPHPTKDIVLAELRLLMSAGAIEMDGDSFGKGGGALPNGVLIEYVDDGVITDLGNLTVNEEILMLPVRSDVLLNTASANDVLALSFDLAGVLSLHAAHPTDRIRVVVRDDLTTGARGLNYFKFAAFGSLIDP
jgi:hypothetical protein